MASLKSSLKKQDILRRQLYGKAQGADKVTFSLPSKSNEPARTPLKTDHPTPVLASEESYLKKDLLKILYLSLAAFALQGLLFFAISNNLVSFKF